MSRAGKRSKRRKGDYYPTPKPALLALLPFLRRSVPIWEPAKGDGRLIRYLRQNGFNAKGSDINEGWDYLKSRHRRKCTLTNPPFSLAKEFICHSLKWSDETFMLLRLNFLASKKRRRWWRKRRPNAIFILGNRPSFTGDGRTDGCEYAWFYWGPRKFKRAFYFI